MAQLALNSVRKAYDGVEVIHGIDLSVKSGEFCVFVGPSGCGKSTLLRMIAGLEEITGGTVVIDGEVLNRVPAARRGLAMVFQSYALYPHMSVRQNLSFGLENMAMDRAEIARRVDEAGRMLQIGELLDRRPAALSGGQKQRVAIGRAVVREPRVFLFDEPLSNLDAELRVAMRGEIATLHERLGNTMIYVTHDQVEAMTMADKIAVLRRGRVEQFGRPLDLFNAPANRFVAGFIGSPSMNFISGTVGEGGVRCESGDMLALPEGRFRPSLGQAVEVGVRPAHLSLHAHGMEVTVDAVEQLGTESYIYGRLNGGTPLVIHEAGQTGIARGAVITARHDPERTHLFDANTGASLALSG